MTSYRAKLQFTLAMTMALSCHVACSSTTNETAAPGDGGTTADPSSCTVAGRAGKSQCQADSPPGFPAKDPITCSAGTFCYTGSAYEAKCQPGCQSDENCGPSERCVRCSGSAAGSCRTCTVTDADACTTPKPDAGPEAGPAKCDRDTFFDKDCVSPGKAFSCPTTIEPTGQGTCAQTDLAGIWCCGGAVAKCKRDTVIDQAECGHPGPSGPRPPKGYTCDSGSEPTDPKCVQGDLPIHWCCPS